jgi:Sulfotransferase family
MSTDPGAEQAPEGTQAATTAPRVGPVPDFYIVGQPKSGTTALYEMLRSHPQVFMPDYKEPRYFATDLPSNYQEPRKSGKPAETYEDYLSLFAPAMPGQRVGDASTAYIWSKTAAAEIAKARPDARIIVFFREPASFLRSMHLQLLQIRVEHKTTLREALAIEDDRRAGRELPEAIAPWPQVLLYRERIRYVEQLRRFHAAFPREQVLTLIYDDFRGDNEGTVNCVLRFLEVDESIAVQASEANPTVRMRSPRLDRAVRSVTVSRNPVSRNARRVAKALLPPAQRERLRRAIWGKLVFGRPHAPEEDLMLDLRRQFKPEVQALGDYLDRDLVALWGYDDLA